MHVTLIPAVRPFTRVDILHWVSLVSFPRQWKQCSRSRGNVSRRATEYSGVTRATIYYWTFACQVNNMCYLSVEIPVVYTLHQQLHLSVDHHCTLPPTGCSYTPPPYHLYWSLHPLTLYLLFCKDLLWYVCIGEMK